MCEMGNAQDAENGGQAQSDQDIDPSDRDPVNDLLEDFADEAADIILREFAAAEVRIVCCKPSPFADIAAACAEVRKTRD